MPACCAADGSKAWSHSWREKCQLTGPWSPCVHVPCRCPVCMSMCTSCVHVLCARPVYMSCVRPVCMSVCTSHVHVLCTRPVCMSVYTSRVHVPCACPMCMSCVHIPCACPVYMSRVHIRVHVPCAPLPYLPGSPSFPGLPRTHPGSQKIFWTGKDRLGDAVAPPASWSGVL